MSDFPRVRVTGGPSPRDLEVSIDGEKVKSIFELDIHAGVNQAISTTIRQYVEVDASLVIEGPVERGFVVVVRVPEGEAGVIRAWNEVGRGTGRTLREAVMAAAESISEEKPN